MLLSYLRDRSRKWSSPSDVHWQSGMCTRQASFSLHCTRPGLESGLSGGHHGPEHLFCTFPIAQSPEFCLCFRRCLLRWMEFAICALWVRSFLSGPGTGGRIRYYPTDREPNSETVRIPRSPRTERYRAFWSSSRWRLFCPSPWSSPSRLVGVPSSAIRRLAAPP